MRHVLRARTQMECGDNLRERVDCQPEPQHLIVAPKSGAQFVQLEVWDMQSAKEAIVQRLSVQTCASEPGSDGGLSKAKDTLSSRRIQPFGQRSQHHCDLMGRGFQTVQGRVASST